MSITSMVVGATAVLVDLLVAGRVSGFYVARNEQDNSIKVDFGTFIDGEPVGGTIVVSPDEATRDLGPTIRSMVDKIHAGGKQTPDPTLVHL